MDAQINEIREWVEHWIIGLNLCPFAKSVYDSDLIRISLCSLDQKESKYRFFLDEVLLLDKSPASTISNSILIFSKGLERFDDYLEFYYGLELLLKELDLDVFFQLASFHPAYVFEGSTFEETSNYTNRSPLPLVHILRVTEVEKAIMNHSNIERVPQDNIDKLNKMDLQEIKHILNRK